MGYKYSFVDNAEYGATDVNDAIKKLVSAGVEDPFTDGLPYNASKLNDVIYAVASDGVVPESNITLKCSISANEENTVLVNPGTAFFANGSTITIDSEGEKLTYTPGVVNYVYLLASPSENRNYPVCSTTAPSGDFVMLAEITTDGTLTDKRKYAKGKLPGYCSNFNTTMHYKKILELPLVNGAYQVPEPISIDLGAENNYAILYQTPFEQKNSWGNTHWGGGAYNLKTGIGTFGYLYEYATASERMVLYLGGYGESGNFRYNSLIADISVKDNILTITFSNPTYSWSSLPSMLFATLEFYLFSEGAKVE